MPRFGHLAWNVIYQPGVIEARGFADGRVVLTERRETTGPARSLRMTADRTTIDADGEDVAIVKVEALDCAGPAGADREPQAALQGAGAGKLIGVGNGDPNCLESDKGSERSLFNGLAQLIVQSVKRRGPILIDIPPLSTPLPTRTRRSFE